MTTTAPAPAQTHPDHERGLPLRLVVTLAFIAAFSPLAVDLYLASFPVIRRDLATSPGSVQLTLTAYLVGVSVGQPVWGPLSDRYGRRRMLLLSNTITVVSSVAVVLAPTIGVLVGARLVQALSAAAGMVIARAMVADLATGYAGVRALALMMTTVGAVPVVAPAAGGALAAFLPWRGVLAVLAVMAAVQLVVTLVAVGETLPAERRSPRLDYGDLARVVLRPAYVTYALTLGLCVASVMSYVASASFVYQDVLGFSPLVFGVAFAVNALGMASAGFLSARLARRRHHPARTVARALPGAVLCCLLVVGAALSPWPLLMVVPIFGNAFFSNLVMGNCMGLAMEQARGLTGAGSAMLGLFMFGISAAVTPVAGLVGGVGPAVSMGLVMAAMAVLASLSFTLGRAWIARHPVSEATFA